MSWLKSDNGLLFVIRFQNIYFWVGGPYLTHESNIMNMPCVYAGEMVLITQSYDRFFPLNYFCYFKYIGCDKPVRI